MLSLGLVAALSLLAPMSASATTVPEARSSESNIHAAYVKLGLTWEGSTFKHPGFLMAVDESGLFEISAGGKKHEVNVSFREVSEKFLTIHVEYAINGSTQWIEDFEVEAGVDKIVQKGKAKLTFNVDPQGSEDTSRDDNDKLDGPKHDEDDPLGGGLLKP